MAEGRIFGGWLNFKFKTLVLFLIIIHPAAAFLFPKSNKLLPGDSLVFVGETLRVTCSSEKLKNDVSKALFKIQAGENSWYQENVTEVDSSTAETHILITENFAAVSSLTCFKEQEYLKAMKIYVEKPLKPVSNFSGFFFDDDEPYSMVKWSNNSEYYLAPQNIKTEARIVTNGTPQNWSHAALCEEIDSCKVDYGGEYYLSFHFNTSHARAHLRREPEYLQPLYETFVESTHMFNLIQNRKTGALTNVQVKNINHTCIDVSWSLPYYFTKKCSNCSSLLYKMELQTSDAAEHLSIRGLQNLEVNEPITVCNLTSFTSYNLTAWVKKEEKNPWSEASSQIQLLTAEDRPLTGPQVTSTSYHVLGPGEKGWRPVRIYWNTQPKSSIRGQITGYEVHEQNLKTKLRLSSNFYASELPIASGSEIKIYTSTKVGPSVSPSVVYVPAADADKGLLESSIDLTVEEILIAKTKMLNVTWKADALDESEGQIILTFYMCEEERPKACLSDYQVTQANLSMGQIELSYVSLSVDLFGYALERSTGQKRGIEWTDCVYQADQIPAKPEDLQAFPGEKSGSVRITWSNTRCDRKKKALVYAYNLTICAQQHPSKASSEGFDVKECRSATYPSDRPSIYVFDNLVADQTYQVYLQAKSLSGSSPEAQTETKSAKVSGSSEGLPTEAIIMIVLLLIVILGAIFCCYIKRHINRVNLQRKKMLMLLSVTDKKQEALDTNEDSGISSAANKQPTVSDPPLLPRREQNPEKEDIPLSPIVVASSMAEANTPEPDGSIKDAPTSDTLKAYVKQNADPSQVSTSAEQDGYGEPQATPDDGLSSEWQDMQYTHAFACTDKPLSIEFNDLQDEGALCSSPESVEKQLVVSNKVSEMPCGVADSGYKAQAFIQ
ncbi:interleukin-6 receptor subunit beta [Plakobranchus ocellatus]|uniref:Interleukin-6 receptor subunit beta n=1 Tax=Plakobranchus ocellatus TaxID=259542 RepID=A0AAV3Z7X1_9GAST|nr:interleukin-6 receptor subunit beta [Plakobranchus ocellatus]